MTRTNRFSKDHFKSEPVAYDCCITCAHSAHNPLDQLTCIKEAVPDDFYTEGPLVYPDDICEFYKQGICPKQFLMHVNIFSDDEERRREAVLQLFMFCERFLNEKK